MGLKVNVRRFDSGRCTLWMGGDVSFNFDDFFKVIGSLNVIRIERIHACYGPAEFTDEVHTAQGRFCIHVEIDGYAGTSIYSDNAELMWTIHGLMKASVLYDVAD